MMESTSVTFPSRTVRRLVSLVRLCSFLGFFLGSLVPLYIPQGAESADAAEFPESDQFLLVEEGFVMKTASISEQGHRLAYSKSVAHEVGQAESLSSIADLYDISIDTIRFANNLKEGQTIHPGNTLVILPVDGVLHTVQRGQSLLKIASLYDIDVENIVRQNQIDDEKIFAGQEIIIPGGRPLLAKATSTVAVASPPSPSGEPEAVEDRPRPTQPPEGTPPTSFGIFQKPCDCAYTQYYRAGHYAVDMAKNGGVPIFAAEDGVVIRAEYGWNGGYGNVLEIDHGEGLVTLYAHNKELHVREGAAVRRGEVISTMGKTGRVYGATGVHLHFEVILDGVKKNPLLYLQ